MRRGVLAAAGLLATLEAVGCIDFNAELGDCIDAGRCVDTRPHLTVVDRYVTGTGVLDVPWDAGAIAPDGVVPASVLQAFVDGGAVPVYWSAPGVFYLAIDAGVPYLVGRLPPGYDHPQFLASSLANLDMGLWILGRPNVATASAGTTFVVDAGGMTAWDSNNDVLEIACPNAGLGGDYLYIPNYQPPFPLVNPPADGDTSLAMTVDWGMYTTAPLIDATQGDQTIIYQLGTATSPSGFVYANIASALNQVSQQLSLMDGLTVTLTGNFNTVTPNLSATVQYDLDGFNAVTPDSIHEFPGTYVPQGGEAVFIEAMFGGTAYGRYNAMPDVAVAFVDAGTGVASEPISFGDPFPSTWTLEILAGQISIVPFTATLTDGGMGAAQGEADITVEAVLDGGSLTVAPLVSTVTSPLVDGQIADFATISNATTTPIISWTPGATLATPTYYTVVVSEITGNNADLQPTDVLGIVTGETQVQVPPGYLQPGHTYVVRYAAAYDPNGGFPNAPDLAGYPFGIAESLSWPFTP